MTLFGRSLRARISLNSLAVTFSVLMLVMSLIFIAVRGFLRDNLVEAINYRLRIAMDNIDGNLRRIGAMADWASLNHEIINFVKTAPTDTLLKRREALAAHRSLRDSMYSGGIDKYIDKILIADLNKSAIQVGLVNGHADDYTVCRSWFDSHDFERAGDLGDRVEASPFMFSSDNAVVPLLRRIYDYEAKKVIGFAAFAVNDKVFTDPLIQYDLETGTRLFAVLGKVAYELSDRASIAVLEDSEESAALMEAAASYQSTTISAASEKKGQVFAADIELSGKSRTLVLVEGKSTGWVIAQSLPTIQFGHQNRVFAGLFALIGGGMMLLVFLVLIALDRSVNRPIARINRRVNMIATGDFSYDPTIESDNELGHIGRAVNRMSKDIEELLAQRLSDEKAKKSLEFRMLQSQINPHFLYNTLNIIKWSASIQKAEGIAEMTGSLATLLRHAARGTDELVPLSLELDLVREYCTIQAYRSALLFELEIDINDPLLLSAELMKFTLQPLVENALIHGIEPKGRAGIIRIGAERPNPDEVYITVRDDGVGIAAERLTDIMKTAAPAKRAFNHIGLVNIDERIKLSFGDRYGLSVESVEGEYTILTVRLPFQESAKNAEGEAADARLVDS